MKNFLKLSMLSISLIIILLPLFSQQEHEKIVEEVSVNWWQVPVFAVDKDGSPVSDLQPGDIQVRLNGREIPAFTLFKRSFTVTKQGKDRARPQQLPIKKNKVLFLLFDQVLSSETSTRDAKVIAKKIIKDAEEDTRFVVMTIDAFSGLLYIGEGSADNKDYLLNMIERKVKRKRNKRYIPLEDFVSGSGGYEPDDMPFFFESVGKWVKRKNMGFFSAFETLCLFLNSIEDNKFIYLFSEGLSSTIIQKSSRNVGGEQGPYYHYFKNAANSLSRSGAMIFIINSTGMLQYSTLTSSLSGKDTLHLLATESGGTYLEGTHEKIVERLENMHRAYYEISFPDIPLLKGTIRKVSITPKRKGIKIHSLRTLEKRKHYIQMNSLEKEILVLNLVTQPDNSLIRSTISAYNARVDKTKKDKKGVTYTIKLPPGYLQQQIDLYKVWLAVNDQGLARLEKMEKESLYPRKDRVKIQFQLTPGTKDKKQEQEKKEIEGETETYFVLVNRGPEPARACVHGMELYEEDPELIAEEKKKLAKEQKKGEIISKEEMAGILQGAAHYCQKLKQSAFHFYCREKVLETRKTINDSVERGRISYLRRRVINRTPEEIYRMGYTQVKNYVFGYRLIKQGDRIIEERDWISSGDNVKVKRDQVVKTNAFFSEKAVFAPITILDPTRQDRYNFQFIRFDERNGRPAAVIEALPKNPAETAAIYGTLWIDKEDFSILKIKANPQSIKSYKLLKDLALKLRTRLHLSLEIDFDRQQKGIRFPTKISFLEKYKGGRIISTNRAPNGWERTRTRFVYSDYRFFSVQTDVTVQEADQSVNQ
jgi:VWFA-related protein